MKKIIVANWKLNPDSPREARELFVKIKRTVSRLKRVETVICPPAIFLPDLEKARGAAKKLALGGQDAFPALDGAWTGQISPAMIRKSGARYLILGHSERRAQGDTDELINQKLKLALAQGLKVILCVGEKTRDPQGHYLQTIKTQLLTALEKVPRKLASQLIIAYEPVWAIGDAAKFSDTPAGFLEQAIYIRKILSIWIEQKAAMQVPVLYGGSVDARNALGFLTEGQADGLLVGRASLRADIFGEILKLADALA